jgi:cysteine-rich repeat protein
MDTAVYGDASAEEPIEDTVEAHDVVHDPTRPECGNGILEEGEECDDGPVNSDTRPDACREDCRHHRCGDGVKDSGEPCDGADLGGENCESRGYDGGSLRCDGACSFDEVGCGFTPRCLRYVDVDSVAPAPDGSSWASAFASIQDGIDSAYDAVRLDDVLDVCEVWVSEGTYLIYESSRDDTLQLRPGVSLYGGFSGREVVLVERDHEAHECRLDGAIETDYWHSVRHVVTGSDDAVIDGFVIANGMARGPGESMDSVGGGMLNNESSPTIANCTFLYNLAENGGGIGNYLASPVIARSRFIGNEAVSLGGGIVNLDSSPTITDCIFEENTASLGGGAVFNGDTSTAISNCTFHLNQAEEGGCIYNLGGSPTVLSSVFHSCLAWRGAGAYNQYSTPFFANCTFISNEAGISGGGLYNWGYTSPSPACTNCILWDSSPDEVFNDGGASLDATYSVVQGGYPGTGNLDEDPMLLDGLHGDFHLLPSSPCIDAADGNEAPEEDLEGNPRLDDPSRANTGTGDPPFADIGAFEYVP